MRRSPPSFGSQELEEERPLLSARNDHSSTEGDIQPSATRKSIFTRCFQAASKTFNGSRSGPDLTPVIQNLEEWEKPNSGLAPIKSQVEHSLCRYLGCGWVDYSPSAASAATQKIVEIPITSFIRVSEQGQSKPEIMNELRKLRKVKSDWTRDWYDWIAYKGKPKDWTRKFTDDPANRNLVQTLVNNVIRGLGECIEIRREAREHLSERESSCENISDDENQMDEKFDDPRVAPALGKLDSVYAVRRET